MAGTSPTSGISCAAPGTIPLNGILAYGTSALLETFQSGPPDFPVTAETTIRLARSPKLEERLAGITDQSTFRGWLSGIVLLHILARSQHEETRETASRAEAFRMVEGAFIRLRERGGNEKTMLTRAQALARLDPDVRG